MEYSVLIQYLRVVLKLLLYYRSEKDRWQLPWKVALSALKIVSKNGMRAAKVLDYMKQYCLICSFFHLVQKKILEGNYESILSSISNFLQN
jgi:hypothetical protein